MDEELEELQERVEELENDVDALQSELEDTESALEEAREEIEKLEQENENLRCGILDVTNFKRELEIRGLMTSELDDFIENYLIFSNAIP